jgi:hypothetical protein
MSCNGVPQLGGEGFVCSKKWAVPAATKTRMVQFANVLGTIMQNPQASDGEHATNRDKDNSSKTKMCAKRIREKALLSSAQQPSPV